MVIDGGGVVVPGAGRRIAIVGLDDVVVVDTPDALLVTTRARAQDVKLVVDRSRPRAAPTSPDPARPFPTSCEFPTWSEP